MNDEAKSAPAFKRLDVAPMDGPSVDGETALSVRNVNAFYGDFQALHDITFDMLEKKVTALIGPSGCGKSTFLRWINRMNDLIPGARIEGSLDLHGRDILDTELDVVQHRRRVGMVFQKPNPFPKSIYENVAFGPRLNRKMTRSEMDEIVEVSLQEAALWDEVKDRLKKSALPPPGVQQQRLSTARATAGNPERPFMH